jgi:hypothetical protein
LRNLTGDELRGKAFNLRRAAHLSSRLKLGSKDSFFNKARCSAYRFTSFTRFSSRFIKESFAMLHL